MNLRTLRRLFLWCTLINFGVLLLWTVISVLPHGWMFNLWGHWFRLKPEQFEFVLFLGLLLDKVLILVFNIVPYLALLIVSRMDGDVEVRKDF
ncbi:MAG TPA: hypothetical protein VFT74_08300 [Isosphaeraceae bacterium]|nr:hypothetical protein [Isosphaeraceae bacterium]